MGKNMKERYPPRTRTQKLGYLVEECGEVLAAAGKIARWGTESVNPELPEHEQETNADWPLRELREEILNVRGKGKVG